VSSVRHNPSQSPLRFRVLWGPWMVRWPIVRAIGSAILHSEKILSYDRRDLFMVLCCGPSSSHFIIGARPFLELRLNLLRPIRTAAGITAPQIGARFP